eukprot:276005_1
MTLSVTSPREQESSKSICLYDQSDNMISVLTNIGFRQISKIADTLQGGIYSATHDENCKSMVIKVTNRYLHNQSSALINNNLYNCNENIIIESNILKYLTQKSHCPDSIVKFVSFSETNTDYLLCMENGGSSSLFQFIRKGHELIKSKTIEIDHWRKACKIIFKQMVECIDYIHSQNIIHFDISLENFLINDVKIILKQFKKKDDILEFQLDDIKIKICDFGLARVVKPTEISTRFVGKSNYKSPENCNKQEFDPQQNDIWSLGICLFCLITGIFPFNKAVDSDDAFKFIMKYHKMSELLNS